MRVGGFIMIDNIIWGGKLMDPKAREEPDAKTLYECGQKIMADE